MKMTIKGIEITVTDMEGPTALCEWQDSKGNHSIELFPMDGHEYPTRNCISIQLYSKVTPWKRPKGRFENKAFAGLKVRTA